MYNTIKQRLQAFRKKKLVNVSTAFNLLHVQTATCNNLISINVIHHNFPLIWLINYKFID